jgi:ketosteroid isomerase-like protein
MRSDPEGVLDGVTRAYALGDLQATAAYFADNAVYAIYVDADVLPFAREVVGRSEILRVWQEVREHFELLTYEPRNVTCEDDIVRYQIKYAFRHRASGEAIDGVMRIVGQITNGQFVRYREYHDQERLRAFMRLVDYDGNATPKNWSVT